MSADERAWAGIGIVCAVLISLTLWVAIIGFGVLIGAWLGLATVGVIVGTT